MHKITVTGTASVRFSKVIYNVSAEEARDVARQTALEFADCNIDDTDITEMLEIETCEVKIR